jgi:hypothetical protein
MSRKNLLNCLIINNLRITSTEHPVFGDQKRIELLFLDPEFRDLQTPLSACITALILKV